MNSSKVLIADFLEPFVVEELKAAGLEVQMDPNLKEDALRDKMLAFKPQILVVRSTEVEADHLKSPGLALVIRAGDPVDNIDLDTASALGIFVANCPGKNANAVVELAWGLIFAADRRLAEATMDLKAGKWNRKGLVDGAGLFGRTIGLVGLGQVGLRMIAPAKSFGMRVIAYSRSLTEELAADLGIEKVADLVTLAAKSDVISVHLGFNNQTKNIMGKPFFDAMKKETIFVNTAKAELVDRKALLSAAKQKELRLGLDVLHDEPSMSERDIEEPLADIYGSVFSHHTAAVTRQAREAIARKTVDLILAFDRTAEVPDAVNIQKVSEYTQTLVVRHANVPGVLASVLANVRDQGFNVVDISTDLFDGEKAAVSRIRMAGYGEINDDTILVCHEGVLEVRVARRRSKS